MRSWTFIPHIKILFGDIKPHCHHPTIFQHSAFNIEKAAIAFYMKYSSARAGSERKLSLILGFQVCKRVFVNLWHSLGS